MRRDKATRSHKGTDGRRGIETYRNAIRILLADALGLGLALLERVLVFEFGAHLVAIVC